MKEIMTLIFGNTSTNIIPGTTRLLMDGFLILSLMQMTWNQIVPNDHQIRFTKNVRSTIMFKKIKAGIRRGLKQKQTSRSSHCNQHVVGLVSRLFSGYVMAMKLICKLFPALLELLLLRMGLLSLRWRGLWRKCELCRSQSRPGGG